MCIRDSREIGTRDLSFKSFAQALGPEIFRLKTVKVKTVLRLVKRMEEWNALDVIPVVVSHQDMRVNSVLGGLFFPSIAEQS